MVASEADNLAQMSAADTTLALACGEVLAVVRSFARKFDAYTATLDHLTFHRVSSQVRVEGNFHHL